MPRALKALAVAALLALGLAAPAAAAGHAYADHTSTTGGVHTTGTTEGHSP